MKTAQLPSPCCTSKLMPRSQVYRKVLDQDWRQL